MELDSKHQAGLLNWKVLLSFKPHCVLNCQQKSLMQGEHTKLYFCNFLLGFL